ncbi:MAG TPA: glycosyltransferase family 2 protein [Clostridiales bacterium]|nr:glycosyltransferase family 2 protein [Clostridiales bacterium]
MINTLLDLSFYAFLALCVLLIIYYIPRLRGWFASFKTQKRLYNNKKNNIAILIPARDESKVIGQLLASINNQTYPKKHFGVHIIVKEHDDPTIELAKQVNGVIHIAPNQTCKGDALDVCLKELLAHNPDKYDAYLIIDADCMLTDTFLEEMNNALASGKQVIQGKKIVKNYHIKDKKANSLASSCNGLIWTIIDDMGNRYKADNNITQMTIGTGLMLRSDVIKMLGGWPYKKTLTEDIELMFDCMVKKISTYYYSYAVFYMEESTSLKVTNKRRTRWLTGVVDSKRLYKKQVKLAAKTKEDKRNKYYVLALWPVFYFIGACVIFSGSQFLSAILLFVFKNDLWMKSFLYAAIGIGIIYFSFFLLTLMCLIVERKNMPISIFKKIILLFVHPIFYMGYIPIISKALFTKKNRGWEVIDRIDFKMQIPQTKIDEEITVERIPDEEGEFVCQLQD